LNPFSLLPDRGFLSARAHPCNEKVSGVARAECRACRESFPEVNPFIVRSTMKHDMPVVISFATLFLISPTEEKKLSAIIGQTDPHLLAVQNVFVSQSRRASTRAHHIRTGARFSQSISRQLLALACGTRYFCFCSSVPHV
jgi:hypothetical protein